MKIQKIHARQILDSRGNPTVEAEVILDDSTLGRAAVPSGASTGIHEAVELRDNDPKNYQGKSVLKAVENVNTIIADALFGQSVEDQEKIDQIMIDLDGTENNSRLGANAILAVSLASAKAAALSQKKPFYEYIADLSGNTGQFLLPLPMMNIINGGKHGGWATDLQEYLVFPIGATSFSKSVEMGSELFHALSDVLSEKGYSIAVGDEGGFCPHFKNGNTEPFDLISQAIKKIGLKTGVDFVYGVDFASSEYYKNGKYNLKSAGKTYATDEMISWLKSLTEKYPIVSIEDGLAQDDWEGWTKLTAILGNKIQLVGDDLLVTNTKFLQTAIDKKAANAILIKPNQIGTLSETLQTVKLAKKAGYKVIISHRSGETSDTTITHLSVGLSSGQIKTGSVSRTDRIAKYNELLRIEEALGPNAKFAGKSALKK